MSLILSPAGIGFRLLSLLCLLMAALPARAITSENEKLLLRLDSIIERNPDLVKEKDARIEGLRSHFMRARSNAERLGVARQLYDEYVVYDSDSALYYASEAHKLARRTAPDDYQLLADCRMNEAFIYIVLGLYDQAMDLLKGVHSDILPPESRTVYYELMAYAHSMRALYLHSNKEIWREDIDRANLFRDSIRNLDVKISDEWTWVPVAMALDRDGDISDVDITPLRRVVEKDTSPRRQNAINAYWLARYYKQKGNEDEMIKYMTLASTYDALIVNREIAAIQELAEYLYNHGQINRAYNYLLYADAQANKYHNRYRLVSLTDVLPGVRDAYREEIHKRDRRLKWLVGLLALLSIGLIASIIFIIMEMRKIRKTKDLLRTANDDLNKTIGSRDAAIADLEKANDSLTEVNDQLSLTNDRLSEANKQKLGLLAYSLRLTTENIQALEDYRKKLLKKYKVNKIADLGILINDPELLRDHYNGFYEGFDKMILTLFPNFVEDYNATVPDDARFSPEAIAKSRSLNTRLRIYALKRLGVSKSADIANMLNVSIRTVYNNRSTSSSAGSSQSAENSSQNITPDSAPDTPQESVTAG